MDICSLITFIYLNPVVAAHSLVVVFRIYDVDRDGYISKDDLGQVCVKSNIWSVLHSGASVLFEVSFKLDNPVSMEME